MDEKFFEEGQLLDLKENENDNAGNSDDIQLEGIDLSKWDKRNALWLVPEEHRLEVLRHSMIVKWQDTGQDTELRSWSHETSYGTDSQKIWQNMLQDT